MSTRILRVDADEDRFLSVSDVLYAFDAAPDEATLPTIDWCDIHGPKADRLGCRHVNACRVVSVPVPLYLGVPVSA